MTADLSNVGAASSVQARDGTYRVEPVAVWGWLAAGWRDLRTGPGSSLAYGGLVWLCSLLLVACLFQRGYDYVLFPLTAGFLIVGPFLALGLYEKSRRIAAGEPVNLLGMILVAPASGGQILFAGALLCLLMLAWMRAAVLIWALFFGLLPFPGLDRTVSTLFTTPTGWVMLVAGSAVGGLFAAFSFAISVFALPMQLTERTDALTAMGSSMAMVWRQLPVMVSWGAVVVGLFLVSVATGFLGLIVLFPLLGHATWHACRAMYGHEAISGGACSRLES
ncbi:DUF2189 domain-containing protein [Ancylobacter sp. A5.8]|uniref:DUF2189 domain-containing protein n=1 Tax=Ancylobacter gelatini TaxID=2919920 RepID=UPI001F4E0EBF|nr:DUF2189 domain-containing protein [Ancylobacter gelatini]MCJ8143301.1 DUF2189 domain-containing protein [Ancylobacter gelatini]